MRLADAIQEVRELGLSRTAFRVCWELRLRTGWAARRTPSPRLSDLAAGARNWPKRLPLGDPVDVARAIGPLLSDSAREDLGRQAAQAAQGRILAFGRWPADFGHPIDWHLNPSTGQRWDSRLPWPAALGEESRVGDVKHTWEIARFAHAYVMARAASLARVEPELVAHALDAQVASFISENPRPLGIHWGSGQETVIRLLAWVFATVTLFQRTSLASEACGRVGDALLEGAEHVARHLDYARKAVYNNHLLAEALGLYMVGSLIPEAPAAEHWLRLGRELLDEQADRQFYKDGAYRLQSFNYQRGAVLLLLWAVVVARAAGDSPGESWVRALGRSADFLLGHMDPVSGGLPNYGPNDGSLPSALSTCDFQDYRPVLQAAHLACRNERLFEPGPWDEAAAWLLGVDALNAPLRRPRLSSVSFQPSGYHVLRGRNPSTITSFRCGSVRDRFGQIDMLHLDVRWRGHNVLVDGGSYQYNGAEDWHRHFMSAASHNTVTVDGHDQMLHVRRFKFLYWTEASLLAFQEGEAWSIVAGEHYGFRRHRGACIHRRSVLHAKDDLWLVVDNVIGAGSHAARLHWLCGDYPYRVEQSGTVTLATPEGDFGVGVWSGDGALVPLDVARGALRPLRGWCSRYYGEKIAAPALVAEATGPCPIVFVTVLGAGQPQLRRREDDLEAVAGTLRARLRLKDGLLEGVAVGPA